MAEISENGRGGGRGEGGGEGGKGGFYYFVMT